MASLDPTTGQSLPEDAIQRVLFIVATVHVYDIPPMTPGKGHVAASWTADENKRHIFTARLRVLETAITQASGEQKVKADILLEDPRNGQLFAAAPYTAVVVVEPVSDSSRFFALRVQDEAGRKATLGIGFEERTDAFDFGVSLQEAQKTLGLVQSSQPGKSTERKDSGEKRDLSLKEGETITVNLPARFGRPKPQTGEEASSASLSSFSLPPPPSVTTSSGGGIPPPPPAPSTSSRAKRLSANLGFDDGQFGEFA